MARHLSALLLMTVLAGCPKRIEPHLEPQPPAPTPPSAAQPAAPSGPGLVLKVEPPHAELIVDGNSLGPAQELAQRGNFLPLKSGIYQVAIKCPGFVPWRAEVTVNDAPEVLEVRLIPKPRN